MKKYPFKFLNAYGKEDGDIFFGREPEIEALYEMCLQSPLLLVYGASGTGKTSLILCGLAGKFKPHEWLPITIRRGGNINDNLEKALADTAGKSAGKGRTDRLYKLFDKQGVAGVATQPLTRLAKAIKAVYLDSFRPVYLIFDQLEELFILGSEEEELGFIQSVKEILEMDLPVKIIFSIREEYLGYLNRLEKAVPQLLRKKLRVEPMNLEKVKQVITGVASVTNSCVHIKAGEEDAVANGVFEKIKGNEKSLTIQLPYLQVFLDRLYMDITHDDKQQSEAEFSMAALDKIGNIGDVLREFLDNQVEAVQRQLNTGGQHVAEKDIWGILSPFATLESTKAPITKQELYAALKNVVPEETIDRVVEGFITGRILRYAQDTDRYELVHDALAKRVAEHRSDEEIALLQIRNLIKTQAALKAGARALFTETQMNYIEPFLEILKLENAGEIALINESRKHIAAEKDAEKTRLEKERNDLLERQRLLLKNQQVQKRFTYGVAAGLVAVLYFAIWALVEERHADKLKQKADILTKKALSAEDSIRTALVAADTAKRRAERYALDAKRKKNEADSAYKKLTEETAVADFANAKADDATAYAAKAHVILDKVISRLDFYNGKWALVENDRKKFGFIDQNLDTLIKCNYDKAEKFDSSTGFAEAMRGGIDYLLDTDGIEYTVAYRVKDLTPQIAALDLQDQDLAVFPEAILKYPQLKILILRGNSLTRLPAGMEDLKNLRTLNLADNDELITLPAEIGNLKNLRSLDLHGTGLNTLPPQIGNLTNLRMLDVHYDQLNALTRSIGDLKNLQTLNLNYTGLARLPAEIGNLKKLEHLVLYGNQLTELPAEIVNLTSLVSLALYSNQLTALPPDIGKLANLRHLNLTDNPITRDFEAVADIKKRLFNCDVILRPR